MNEKKKKIKISKIQQKISDKVSILVNDVHTVESDPVSLLTLQSAAGVQRNN